ncbi:MAG: hypothetical protein Q8N05_13145 [Bacteroidota bacterium]|nr:hypothetical protein [Bacteroidota bacterium]
MVKICGNNISQLDALCCDIVCGTRLFMLTDGNEFFFGIGSSYQFTLKK